MCLETASLEKPKSTGVGYKVFRKRGRVLLGEFSTGPRKIKTWLKSSNYSSNGGATEIQGYAPGFHIFKNLRLTRKWLDSREEIRKVRYHHAYLAGTSTCYLIPTIVAKEIYIYPGKVR